jgi:hypothetical protein
VTVPPVEVTVPVTVQVPVTSVPPATATPQAGKTVIIWWSHWANEPLKRAVIDRIVADYEAEHEDVDIILSYWDAGPLTEAVRSLAVLDEQIEIPIFVKNTRIEKLVFRIAATAASIPVHQIGVGISMLRIFV